MAVAMLLLLAACATEGGLPFLTPAAPPSPGPTPDFPSLIAPPRDAEKPAVLSEPERTALEKELDTQAVDREAEIRKRLEEDK